MTLIKAEQVKGKWNLFYINNYVHEDVRHINTYTPELISSP